MKRILSTLAAGALIAAPYSVQAQDAKVFKPSGQWSADFGDDYCRVARNFSDGSDEIAIAFERTQPTTFTKLLILGNDVRLFRSATSMGYRYLPSGDNREAIFVRSDVDGNQYLTLDGVNMGPNLGGFFGPPPAADEGEDAGAAPGPMAPGTPFYNAEIEMNYAEGITGLALTSGLVKPISIETGSLKNVVEIMQICSYDLLTFWGLDAEKHKTQSRTVVPTEGTSLPQGTIGFQDFARLSGGKNQIRLLIDTEGKPVSCDVQAPSLAEDTNKKVCDHLMGNARFMPALDAEGEPMNSYWMSSPLFMFGPGPGR
jgi:hypothetical protein